MTCKTCIHYENGFDGKPGMCNKLLVADTYSSYDNLQVDGIGYSDDAWTKELAQIFVGKDFGCIHHRPEGSIH